MKLEESFRIGKECGLTTIGECVANIELHSTMFFKYSDIQKEIDELYQEIDDKLLDLDMEIS